jgi:hypothetical protein
MITIIAKSVLKYPVHFHAFTTYTAYNFFELQTVVNFGTLVFENEGIVLNIRMIV